MSAHKLLTELAYEDPLLEPYREIRQRNWTWRSGIFIAEGPLLVQRLLQSSYSVRSVLVEERLVAQYRPLVPEQVPLLAASHDLIERLAGFNFHRGVLACGVRQPLACFSSDLAVANQTDTWLGLFGVQDPENLGGILRTATGFGIQRIVLGPGTGDPFSRRALRVSMGNALKLQMFQARELADFVAISKQLGIECMAATLSSNAEPLEQVQRHGPVMLLLGNEKHGLPQQLIEATGRQVRIDMELGTDSLNVCVAAGIMLYHLTRYGLMKLPNVL